MHFILASASPRRKQLLGLITGDFLVHNSNVDESLDPSLSPEEAARQLACRKALAVSAQMPDCPVIGSDTIVAIDDLILGKPQDDADAAAMLRRLSGRTHTVFTGVCLARPAPHAPVSFVSKALVTFCALTEAEIFDYIKSGEPRDKAGAYGIQGLGARFVQMIQGDYYTVMGLPVCELYHLLRDAGMLDAASPPLYTTDTGA